jgi:hypothetical protein
VNHHLDTTEWRYTQNRDNMMDTGGGLEGIGQMASHPIKVLGPARGPILVSGQPGL